MKPIKFPPKEVGTTKKKPNIVYEIDASSVEEGGRAFIAVVGEDGMFRGRVWNSPSATMDPYRYLRDYVDGYFGSYRERRRRESGINQHASENYFRPLCVVTAEQIQEFARSEREGFIVVLYRGEDRWEAWTNVDSKGKRSRKKTLRVINYPDDYEGEVERVLAFHGIDLEKRK